MDSWEGGVPRRLGSDTPQERPAQSTVLLLHSQCVFRGCYGTDDCVAPIPPFTHCLLGDWVLTFGHKFATIGASYYPTQGTPEHFSYLGLLSLHCLSQQHPDFGVRSLLEINEGRDPQLRV